MRPHFLTASPPFLISCHECHAPFLIFDHDPAPYSSARNNNDWGYGHVANSSCFFGSSYSRLLHRCSTSRLQQPSDALTTTCAEGFHRGRARARCHRMG